MCNVRHTDIFKIFLSNFIQCFDSNRMTQRHRRKHSSLVDVYIIRSSIYLHTKGFFKGISKSIRKLRKLDERQSRDYPRPSGL